MVMNNWFTLSLLSLFFFAGVELFYKVYIDRNKQLSANFISILPNIFLIGIAFVFIIIEHDFSLNHVVWWTLVTESILYVIAVSFFYESYKTISASIAAILGTGSVIVSTTIGILLFNEVISVEKFAGIVLVILAIAILHFKKSRVHIKGFSLALIGGIIFGIAYVFDKYIVVSNGLSPNMVLFLSPIISLPVKLAINRGSVVKQFKNINKPSIVYAVCTAIMIFAAYKMTFLAYIAGGEVGKVDAINNFVVFIIIAGEIVFLKDRSNLTKKILCAFIAVVGIWLLR